MKTVRYKFFINLQPPYLSSIICNRTRLRPSAVLNLFFEVVCDEVVEGNFVNFPLVNIHSGELDTFTPMCPLYAASLNFQMTIRPRFSIQPSSLKCCPIPRASMALERN